MKRRTKYLKQGLAAGWDGALILNVLVMHTAATRSEIKKQLELLGKLRDPDQITRRLTDLKEKGFIYQTNTEKINPATKKKEAVWKLLEI
jgi:hypothetical protein